MLRRKKALTAGARSRDGSTGSRGCPEGRETKETRGTQGAGEAVGVRRPRGRR